MHSALIKFKKNSHKLLDGFYLQDISMYQNMYLDINVSHTLVALLPVKHVLDVPFLFFFFDVYHAWGYSEALLFFVFFAGPIRKRTVISLLVLYTRTSVVHII